MDTLEKQLATLLSRKWWSLLVRGLAAIAFGTLAWMLPEITLTVLVLFFGAFVMLDGILGVWMAITGRNQYDDWILLLLWGLVGIGIGILTFLVPGVTELVLLFFIAPGR